MGFAFLPYMQYSEALFLLGDMSDDIPDLKILFWCWCVSTDFHKLDKWAGSLTQNIFLNTFKKILIFS